MKKLLALLVSALVLSQGAFAQVGSFQVDGTKISFNGEEVDIHDVGSLLEKEQADYQDIFVYVTYDTPLGLAHDLKATIEGSCTAGVVFVNPERNGDFPRLYGPVMVYHSNFLDMEMLRKSNIATFQNTNEDSWNFSLEGAAPDDYTYNSTRMQNCLRTATISENANTEWTNNFDGVVLNLAYQTPIGVLYSFDHDLNNESVPYMNVVYHTEGTPLCPESWFTVVYTGLEEYEFPTIQPVQPVQYNGEDLKTFTKTHRAYASITALEGKNASPGKGRALVEFEITPLGTVQNVKIQRASSLQGLDDVITDYLYGLQGLWTPQFIKGQPVNVKVSCPVYGEISQW